MKTRNEASLIAAVRSGDLESFEDLISPYEERLYRVLLRMVGTEADTEEVLQESLLKAFEKIDTFRAESAFGTWLYRIAVNQALMWLRKTGADPLRRAEDLPRFDSVQVRAIEDWSPSAESLALRSEATEVLTRAVSELPQISCTVVILKDAEGLSHEEIAEITGLSVLAARSRLHRARLLLRERLSEHFRERVAVPAPLMAA